LFSKKFIIAGFALLAILSASIYFCNRWIVNSTAEKMFTDFNTVPFNKVGLILGTSKYNRFGESNLWFKYRIEAAANLYHTGKIKHIIVSGDNRFKEYNEPRDMKKALIKLGIPDSCITLDFAGFRTLDSVIRCKKVFGQNDVTIITQRFHNERAVFIANYYEMNMIGFCAEDVSSENGFIVSLIREPLAKFKAVLDLYILKQEPKFLGKEEKIGN